jgi:tetratricopeptide (TPR) repeat protein
MKKLPILLIMLASLSFCYGQEISYQKTLDDAISLAVKKNKPVFVLLSPPPFRNVPAHASFASGFDSKEVIDFYSKNFICYKTDITDSAGAKIRNRFQITIYPAYIFLDTKGQIVYKGSGNASLPDKYLDMANQALTRMASGKTISNYEQLHQSGSITADQLKDYITLKEELGLFDNAGLIDEYVNFLTIRSFDDYDQVLFILKAGPYAYGKAYNLCHTNQKVIDSIYKYELPQLRSAINGRIRLNTRVEAIKTKNARMIQNDASFTTGIWSKNYREGAKASALEYIYYYKAIKDTTNYFRFASNLYDTYYMNISADSAKKLQKQVIDNLHSSISAKTNSKPVNDTTRKNAITTKVTSYSQVVTVSSSLDVANILNNAAYDFYSSGTCNANYLFKALIWSKRAIDLRPTAGYYDTLAHLMYRLDFYDDALLNQRKAIQMAAEQPIAEVVHLKSELDKMVAHQL